MSIGGKYITEIPQMEADPSIFCPAEKKPDKIRKKLLQKGRLSTIMTVLARYAPLAQLVEHLTLNQGVQGSSP